LHPWDGESCSNMGILKKAIQNIGTPAEASENAALFEGYDYARSGNTYTRAKVAVDEGTAKSIATAYRCGNIISNDIAKLPFQQFRRLDKSVEHVAPDAIIRNLPYLLEIQPNRWMTPFIFKKTVVNWLLWWGEPPQAYRELFPLNASVTTAKLNKAGDIVYETTFPNGQKKTLPAVEVTHLMINSKNGRNGRSVLEFARETFGRQLAAKNTQSDIQGNGLKASAIMKMNSALDKDGRDQVRAAYAEALSEPGGLAVLDTKVADFQTITMKSTDMQFIEGMQLTDVDIINFFEVPAFKLNMGKQSYESNDQQDLDYLKSTLDPYLVQWEQAARLNWTSQQEQPTTYWKFVREALLRTNAKTRAELHEIKIRSGQMTPNEAREVEDMSGYSNGDDFYMTSNYQKMGVPANAQ
jgi:HK97 family phage portal protein